MIKTGDNFKSSRGVAQYLREENVQASMTRRRKRKVSMVAAIVNNGRDAIRQKSRDIQTCRRKAALDVGIHRSILLFCSEKTIEQGPQPFLHTHVIQLIET